MKNYPQETLDRFWQKVVRRGLKACWLWKAYKTPQGYGVFRVDPSGTALAHRFSFSLVKALLPDEDVHHTCLNKGCVNPKHLTAISHGDHLRQERGGEASNLAKLNAAQVRVIRRLWKSSLSQTKIGKIFGVDQLTIGRIWRKETWATAAILLFMFTGAACSSTKQYRAPSVEPVRAGITASQGKVASAQGKVTKAQVSTSKAQASTTNLKKTTAKLQSELERETLDAPILRLLVAEQNRDIDNLTKELLETQSALVETQTDLNDTQKELAKSQASASKLQTEITAQTDTLNATTADLAKTKSAYHKLKFGVIALAMALTVLLMFSIFKFAAFAPPILYGTLAAPIAVGAFLLFKL